MANPRGRGGRYVRNTRLAVRCDDKANDWVKNLTG